MLVESTMYPSDYSINGIKRGRAKVVLRDDIKEKERETEEGDMETIYEYEEVKTELVNRPNLKTYIEDNFNDIFDKALIEEQTPEEPTLKEQIDILEDELLRIEGVRE
ncbi:MAG: hypothetical protein ACOCRO_06235 [Halanaerobiales bacterium]